MFMLTTLVAARRCLSLPGDNFTAGFLDWSLKPWKTHYFNGVTACLHKSGVSAALFDHPSPAHLTGMLHRPYNDPAEACFYASSLFSSVLHMLLCRLCVLLWALPKHRWHRYTPPYCVQTHPEHWSCCCSANAPLSMRFKILAVSEIALIV